MKKATAVASPLLALCLITATSAEPVTHDSHSKHTSTVNQSTHKQSAIQKVKNKRQKSSSDAYTEE